jgi:hypothetical protein
MNEGIDYNSNSTDQAGEETCKLQRVLANL